MHLVLGGAHHDVRVAPAGPVEVRQRRRVAEAVHVVADGGLDPEARKDRPRDLRLHREGLRRRLVAVGLDVPSADDLPPARSDVRLHPGVNLRRAELQHLVEPRLAAGDEDLRVVVQKVAGGARRRHHLVHALFLVPQPHRVEVRIQNYVYLHSSVKSTEKAMSRRSNAAPRQLCSILHATYSLVLVTVEVSMLPVASLLGAR